MSGATFGRKGGAPDADLSGSAFGRKGAIQDAGLAARRAAFLAEERARAQQAGQAAPRGESVAEDFARPPTAERSYLSQTYVPQKSNGTAYLLWLLFGGLSAHRFYLGFTTSAVVQLMLTPIGYVMLANKSLAGVVFVLTAALWILCDLFLIPGLVRKANEQARARSFASGLA